MASGTDGGKGTCAQRIEEGGRAGTVEGGRARTEGVRSGGYEWSTSVVGQEAGPFGRRRLDVGCLAHPGAAARLRTRGWKYGFHSQPSGGATGGLSSPLNDHAARLSK